MSGVHDAGARSARGVLTLDTARFEAACAALLRMASAGQRPDLLIGIRTGGLTVAKAMARSAGYALPVLPVTCRRPSTQTKQRLPWLKAALARLPHGVSDRLRMIEHRMLTSAVPRRDEREHRFDAAELAELDRWLAQSGPAPAILVVDDAVDTGNTLLRVLEMLAQHAPAASIRSAAITLTTAQPLARPDHVVYRGQLCRFPWSLDA